MSDRHDLDGDETGGDGVDRESARSLGATGLRRRRRSARPRLDAFTPARRARFLRHLPKYGCLTDAARKTGVAVRAIHRHQDKDEDFARHVALATQMAAGGIERVAWERAIAGVEEQFACGGKVYTRRRYSESLLRLFLQATDPKKYGPRPGFTRKRLMAWERTKIDPEVRAKIAAEQPTFEEAMEIMSRKLEMMARVEEREKLAAGWQSDEEGRWIPPGWVRADGGDAGNVESHEGNRTPAIPCDSRDSRRSGGRPAR